jgi:hypothetical protein
MKQQNNLFTEPIYNVNTGELNRAETLTVDEYIIHQKREKPNLEALEQLKYIKRLRKRNKQEFYSYRTIEVSIGEILDRKQRGSNKGNFKKNDKIDKIIELIKDIQKQRKITDITKNYIKTILKQFNLNDRTIRRYTNEIVNKSVSKKDRAIEKSILVNMGNYERKLKGELTKTIKKPIERRWIKKGDIETFYSFI